MNKPSLIVITGRPASGKTTLAHLLSGQIKFPLLSRDELKEGYINTAGVHHNQLSKSVDWHIYETFFEAIEVLITREVSIIAEAAFQHTLWNSKLPGFLDKADIKIIICETPPDLAKVRFANRLLNDPGREMFHGDNSIISAGEKTALLIEAYENVSIEVPILHVDTTEKYNPGIEAIVNFIKEKNSR